MSAVAELTSPEDIVNAVLAVLLAPPALAGGRVFDEYNADELPEDQAQQIVISAEGGDPQELVIGQLAWQTALRIDAVCRRAQPGIDPHTAARRHPALGLLGQVWARLMADPTLGGLVQDIEPGPWRKDRDVADSRMGAVFAVLRVRHTTWRNSLASPT